MNPTDMSNHGFKTVTPLTLIRMGVEGSENFPISGIQHDPQELVPFTVSMSLVDHFLLDDLNVRWQLFNLSENRADDATLLKHLFDNWDWSFTISSILLNNLANRFGRKETMEELYLDALDTAGKSKGQFRSEKAHLDNPNFLRRLGMKSVDYIDFIPSENDKEYWHILAAVFLHLPEEMLFWMNAPARRRYFQRHNYTLEWFSGHFSIRILCRIFNLKYRRKNNGTEMSELFSNPRSATSMLYSMRYSNRRPSSIPLDLYEPISSSSVTTNSDSDDDATDARRRGTAAMIEHLQDLGTNPGKDPENESRHGFVHNYVLASRIADAGQEAEARNARIARRFKVLLDTNDLRAEYLWRALVGHKDWRELLGRESKIDRKMLRDRPPTSPLKEGPEESIVVKNALTEPGAYIEVIQWDHLERCSLKGIPQNIRDIFSLSQDGGSTEFCYYDMKPGSYSYWDYYFVPEDEEVLRYRYEPEKFSSGHLNDHGMVLFRMTPVNDTAFASDFYVYWRFWNDCALTSKDGTVYLLSTLPGDQYRYTFARFDEMAAEMLHRRELEQPLGDRVTSPLVRRVLGAQYNSVIHSLLRYIPETEIEDIDYEKVAEGRFGAVIPASWHRKESLAFKETTSETMVALKRLKDIPQDTGTDAKVVDQFVKELQISYLSLAGNPTGCTEFYGFTELEYADPSRPQQKVKQLYLVFEWATHGNLSPYLVNCVQAGRWPEVAGLFKDIFIGLQTLHARGIIHRDIHPGNVLLTTETIPGKFGSPTSSHLTAKLCDFGLCGELTNISSDASSLQRKSGPHKAPELRKKGTKQTIETDIYAAGIFMFNVLRAAAAESIEKQRPAKVLRDLWNLCQRCISEAPERRQSVGLIIMALEFIKQEAAMGALDFINVSFD